MADDPISVPEIATQNNVAVSAPAGDDLETWLEAYFQLAVTTAESSRGVQRRDVGRFLSFMQDELGHSQRPAWTPGCRARSSMRSAPPWAKTAPAAGRTRPSTASSRI